MKKIPIECCADCKERMAETCVQNGIVRGAIIDFDIIAPFCPLQDDDRNELIQEITDLRVEVEQLFDIKRKIAQENAALEVTANLLQDQLKKAVITDILEGK